MILSAIGDTRFAFSTAYGSDMVQRDVWILDIRYGIVDFMLSCQKRFPTNGAPDLINTISNKYLYA